MIGMFLLLVLSALMALFITCLMHRDKDAKMYLLAIIFSLILQPILYKIGRIEMESKPFEYIPAAVKSVDGQKFIVYSREVTKSEINIPDEQKIVYKKVRYSGPFYFPVSESCYVLNEGD